MVGCVNETEDWHLHSRGAVTFFAGYDVYMIGRTTSLVRSAARSKSGRPRPCRSLSLAVQATCAVTSTLATLARYAPHLATWGLAAFGLASPVSTPVLDTVWPLLEWLDALTIIGYFSVSVFSHGATARATGLRISCGQAGPAA